MGLNMKGYLKFLIYVIIIETILGGAGRYFTVGSLSIRMILYAVTIFIFILCLIKDRKNIFINFKTMDINLKLIILFGIWIIFSAMNGYYVSKNSLSEIMRDLTGYASFALVFVFSYALDSKRDVNCITKIVAVCVVIQASAIVLIHYGLGIGILEFNSLNAYLQSIYIGNIGLIAPDSVRIFFKSSIYLQVGFIILLEMVTREISKKKRIIMCIELVIVTYAIILSFTRGFWIAAFVTTLIYIILKRPKRILKTTSIILCGVILMLGLSMVVFGNTNIVYSIASRAGLAHVKQDVATKKVVAIDSGEVVDLSLDYRNKLKNAMFARIEKRPILGNGFGVVITEIGQKVSHSEYMFYDIWVEMGLIGLGIYISMFIALLIKWLSIRKKQVSINELHYLDEYMIALLGVIFTSSLNPFLNSPLGITYLIIVISSINIYKKNLT